MDDAGPFTWFFMIGGAVLTGLLFTVLADNSIGYAPVFGIFGSIWGFQISFFAYDTWMNANILFLAFRGPRKQPDPEPQSEPPPEF